MNGIGYQSVDFWRVALGLGVTTIPLFYLEKQNERWAWGYAVLLVMGFLVTHYGGITQAATYLSKEIGG